MMFRAVVMRSSVGRFTYVVAALLVAGYALIALRGPHGIPEIAARQRQIDDLEKRNTDLAREVEQKRDRIRRLGESPDLEIRQRLQLVKPDEKVFMLQDQEKK